MEQNNMNYNNEVYVKDVLEARFISKVYMTMTLGLVVTSLVAYFLARSEAWFDFMVANRSMTTFIFLGQIGLIIFISAKAKTKKTGVLPWFLIFAASMGIALTSIFYMYKMESILYSFGITGLTFGFMSIVGYTTKKDLTAMGMLLTTFLFGAIIATLLNLFIFKSTGMDLFLSYAILLIFIGLTAYDTQKMKTIAANVSSSHSGMIVYCALTLYLDFINIFLMLLRIFGNRR